MLKTHSNSEFADSDSNSVETNFRIQFRFSFRFLISEFRLDKKIRISGSTEYTYSIRTKYRIIFNIVYHLNGDLKKMKDYIFQQITTMHDDQEKILDVQDFQKHLTTELDKKGLLSTYRNDIIPAPKKGVVVNETKIEKKKDKNAKGEKVEDKKDLQAFKDEYSKQQILAADDIALNKKVADLAKKLAENLKRRH